MAVKIQLRRGTQNEFTSADPTLLDGEVAVVTDEKKIIIGPGAFTSLDSAGKFINYHTDQGLGTVGGSNGTSEIPIKLVGASGQAVAALQVLKNGGSNGILEVFTDNTTELVKINGADGAVDDISLLLKAKASQTAGVLEVQDSAGNTPRFQVKEEGQTLVQPDNTTDVSLDVRGSSGSQSSGIMRVRQGSNDVLVVKSDGVTSEQTVTVDGGSIIAQVEDTAASNVTITPSATDSDKVVTVDGASGTENFSVTAGGKATATSAEISTAPTSFEAIANRAVLAKQDLQSYVHGEKVAGQASFDWFSRKSTAFRIYEFDSTDGSPDSEFATSLISSEVTRTSNSDGDTTTSDPDLGVAPASNVFQCVRVKDGEVCAASMGVKHTALKLSPVTLTTQILTYTSADLVTGKVIRDTDSGTNFFAGESGTSSATTGSSFTFENQTGADLFVAFAFKVSNTANLRNETPGTDNTYTHSVTLTPAPRASGVTQIT